MQTSHAMHTRFRRHIQYKYAHIHTHTHSHATQRTHISDAAQKACHYMRALLRSPHHFFSPGPPAAAPLTNPTAAPKLMRQERIFRHVHDEVMYRRHTFPKVDFCE